jgi:transposase-like protein
MNCPYCHSGRLCKAGFGHGKQRYKCLDCRRHTVSFKGPKGQPLEVKRQALSLYLEGLGFRAIGRLLNVSNVSVLRWIRQFAKDLPPKDPPAIAEVVEIDELHTFVKKRLTPAGCGWLLLAQPIPSLPSHSVTVVLPR